MDSITIYLCHDDTGRTGKQSSFPLLFGSKGDRSEGSPKVGAILKFREGLTPSTTHDRAPKVINRLKGLV